MIRRNYILTVMVILLISFVIAPFFLVAQKEVNIWYFGNGVGLDFNSGTPVPLTDGAVVVAGGVATVADTNGGLLFYTDGFNIFNRNHSIMPDGSGTIVGGQVGQDVVIIPRPGSDSLYYMFIWDLYSIKYSLIDLSLDGGLGDIVPGTKNTFLFSSASQKLLAIHHCNREDFWFITHKWDSDQFYAYPVTSSGIGAPIISAVGVVHQDDGNEVYEEVIGYLKSSSDGKKLASVIFNSNTPGAIELFDFDNSLGTVSNGVMIDSLNEGALCTAFSPDQTKLYVSTFYGQNLYQYNLLDTNITGSKTLIYNFPLYLGGLQLAPDSNIYVSHKDDPYLGVINDPDSLGLACNYADTGIFLNGEQSVFGLPNIIETYLSTPSVLTALFTYDSAAVMTVSFSDSSQGNPLTWSWDFGDGNTDTTQNPTHVYANPGMYNVCLTVSNNCNSDTICDSVAILSTGINQYLITVDELKVYPNPVSTFITVLVNPALKMENGTLRIYGLYGNEVRRIETITTQKIIIDAKELAAGMYFYKLIDNDTIIGSGKFIVE